MITNIIPGNLELPEHFWGTPLGSFEIEAAARNVALMSQVGAWVAGEDTWLPFTETDYREFREQVKPGKPVEYREMDGFRRLKREGYLAAISDEDDRLLVTGKYLGIVANYLRK